MTSMYLQLFSYLYELKIRFVTVMLLVIVSVGGSFITPYLFKIIIERLSTPEQQALALIMALLCAYGIGWIINQLLFQLRIMTICTVLEQSKKLLVRALVDKLLSLSLRFHVERQTGELTNITDKAQHGLEAIFWGVFLSCLPTLLELIVILGVITVSCGLIHSLSFCCFVFSYVHVSYRSLSSMTKLQQAHNAASTQVSAQLVDVLLNIETVKYFTREKYEYERMSKLLQAQEDAALKRWHEDTWLQIKHMLIMGIGIGLSTLYTGYRVHQGTMGLGTFILINTYLLQCMMPLISMGYIIHQVRKGFQDIAALMELLQCQPEVHEAQPGMAVTDVITQSHVTFNKVTFGYTAERTTLNNVSFSVLPGKTVALVGPSGSGKSTIAKLLLRLYDITAGSIELNHVNIRTIPQCTVRTAIGIVPQDITLFNTTLYENIAYGNVDARAHEVYEAARRAQLDVFISSLPQGYETVVGERGLKLSGGEKQRIAIARVLLKKPLLYIFDEATSALDSRTEQEIQTNIRKISAGVTTLIITHRLSTITHADHIIVLDQGTIVEQGTHEELVHKSALYAQLWRKQQQNFPYNHAQGNNEIAL